MAKRFGCTHECWHSSCSTPTGASSYLPEPKLISGELQISSETCVRLREAHICSADGAMPEIFIYLFIHVHAACLVAWSLG